MTGAADAVTRSISGRKMGDLAAAGNAQENRKKDVVSISLHGYLYHSFSAPLLSHSPPPSSQPTLPLRRSKKTQGPLPEPQSWVHS